jgi:hypothetical protein
LEPIEKELEIADRSPPSSHGQVPFQVHPKIFLNLLMIYLNHTIPITYRPPSGPPDINPGLEVIVIF